MGKRKPFIDKNKASHFALVHAGGVETEDGLPGKRVLAPYVPPNQARKGIDVSEFAERIAEMTEEGARGAPKEVAPVTEKALEEEECYFPKDGYDYSQHLKRMDETAVFDAKDPLAPKPADLSKEDQEVLAALAEADAYEDEDEDFFGDLTGTGAAPKEVEAALWGPNHVPDHLAGFDLPDNAVFFDGFGAGGDGDFSDGDEQDCGFSVVDGPRADSTLDAHLERLLEEYDDDQIGELDEEDAMGALDIQYCEDAIEEYLGAKKTLCEGLTELRRDEEVEFRSLTAPGEEERQALHAHLGLQRPAESGTEASTAADSGDEASNSDDEEYEVRVTDAGEQWDCESILSLRSNLSNHPGKIERIRAKRAQKQKLDAVAEDEEEEGDENEDEVVLPDVSFERPAGETPEEKRARKKAVKELNRMCREMKKKNKEVWKKETAKLLATGAKHGADVRSGLRTVPI